MFNQPVEVISMPTATSTKHTVSDKFTKIVSKIEEKPFFEDKERSVYLYKADCLEILSQIPEGSIDMIFADPPYFLSNGGITCHAGKMVSVNKGKWDQSQGTEENHEFNKKWLAACQRVLTPNGT
ncbi:MAG: DNA methyltransferase, partial [Candidatus Omnitrophota bacterium]